MNCDNGKWKKPFVLILDLAFVLFSLFCGKMTEFMLDNFGDCLLYSTVGLKCVGCGGTHCINALSKGMIVEAFRYNSFVVISGIILVLVLILMNLAWVFKSEKANLALRKLCNVKLAIVFAVLLVAYSIGRNVSPFLS